MIVFHEVISKCNPLEIREFWEPASPLSYNILDARPSLAKWVFTATLCTHLSLYEFGSIVFRVNFLVSHQVLKVQILPLLKFKTAKYVSFK